MNLKINEVLGLPQSTAECEDGPIIDARPGSLNVKYDAEGEEGIVWTTFGYDGALAYRFTPDSSVTEPMVQAYSKVVEVLDSEWLKDLEGVAAAAGTPLPSGIRHFVAYFDHTGCLEVLASSVSLR